MPHINKNSIIPLYYQLSDALRNEINIGTYKVGSLLPSERELCETHELSRATVRQAFQLLKDEGLVERIRGIGTRVAVNKKYEENLLGFYDFDLQMIEKGYNADVKILKYEYKDPTVKIKNILNIENGKKILRIDRLRLIDGVALFTEKIYLPENFYNKITKKDFENTDIFAKHLKNKCNIELGEAKIFIEPIILDEVEAGLLEIDYKPAAGLLFERISLDIKRIPIVVTRRVFRGDRCRHLIAISPK